METLTPFVPNNWHATTLGDESHFKFVSTGVKNFADTKNYLSTSSVMGDVIDHIEEVVTYEDRPGRANMNPVANSAWFAKMKDTLKVLCVVNEKFSDQYILSTGFLGVSPKDSDVRFLKQIFLSPSFNREKNTRSKGSTMKAINNAEAKRIPILVPPLNEQKKIVEILEIVDINIEKTNKTISLTEKLKTGLLRKLYQPERLVLLDVVAKRGSGHTPNKNHADYWNGGIKWVSLADSKKLDHRFILETDKEISMLGIDNSSATLHRKNTVIVCRDAAIGKVAILGADDMAVSQHFIAWQCGEKLNYKYLYYWLQLQKPILEQIATGTTIKTIGLSFFKKLEIPLLDLEKQEEIGNIFWTIDEKVETLTQLRKKLILLKNGLMNDLLSGKKRTV